MSDPLVGISFRPLEASDVDRVPIAHQGDPDEVLAEDAPDPEACARVSLCVLDLG